LATKRTQEDGFAFPVFFFEAGQSPAAIRVRAVDRRVILFVVGRAMALLSVKGWRHHDSLLTALPFFVSIFRQQNGHLKRFLPTVSGS
jgi:hypothetical protein